MLVVAGQIAKLVTRNVRVVVTPLVVVTDSVNFGEFQAQLEHNTHRNGRRMKGFI